MTEQIGLEAVLNDSDWQKGVGNYIKNVADMNKKTSGLSRALNTGFMTMGQSVVSFGAKAVKAIGIAAVGATAALGAGIVKLTMDAAALPAIEEAFEGIALTGQWTGKEVLDAMRNMSNGMIDNMTLMQTYNKAAQLVGVTFADELPNAMGYLQKVAAATGEDMGFMLDSLVTGVGRLSPMILDNLGIQVDLTAANEAYAESMGITVSEMTKEQQQAALMNQVLMKLEENTAAMPDVSESAATKMAAFKTSLKNAGLEIGKSFLPAMGVLLETISGLVEDVGPKVAEWAEKAGVWLADFLPMAIQKLSDFWSTVLLPALQMAWSYIQSTIVPILQTLWEWLSTNLPIAIAYVTEHWDEFKGALIAIGAVLAASGIVASIAGIIAALNPVTLAIGAIVAAAALLGAAWSGNWGGIRDTLTEVWTTTLQPALQELQIWLAENLPIAIEALKEFWVNTLQPALEQVWAFIVQTLIPAFGTVVAWLAENIPVAIEAASDFWQNTLKPAIETVWAFITEDLIPVFESVVGWLSENIPTAIETVSDYWENTLKPALDTVWAFMNEFIIPIFEDIITIFDETLRIALEGLALLWEETLQPALETVWSYIDENLLPIFEEIADFIADIATPAIETFKTDGVDLLVEGLQVLVTWLTKVKGWFDKIAQAVADFSWGEVGEGAMPDSPPKLAVGFEMITSQLGNFMDAIKRSVSVFDPWVSAITAGQRNPLDDLIGAGKGIGGIGGSFARMFEKNTLTPMKSELQSMKDELAELDEMRGSSTNAFEINQIWSRRSELLTGIAEKEKEIAAQEEKMLQLQKQQEQLGFLQEQMKLLSFIREQGLNPADILGDIKLGLDASIPDLIAVTSNAMEKIIAAANSTIQDPSKGGFAPSDNMIMSSYDNRTFNMNNNVNMSGGIGMEQFRTMMISVLRSEFGATI